MKLWDRFRWRFVAAYYLAWWLCQGAPKHDLGLTRWQIARTAWHDWYFHFVLWKHDRDRMVPFDELISRLESEDIVD